jgi:hypothetical protein
MGPKNKKDTTTRNTHLNLSETSLFPQTEDNERKMQL